VFSRVCITLSASLKLSWWDAGPRQAKDLNVFLIHVVFWARLPLFSPLLARRVERGWGPACAHGIKELRNYAKPSLEPTVLK